MTPFGDRLRQMRRERGLSQRDMAMALGVSPAYLSALEHGRRGAPSWALVQKVIGYFNVIWDEAEELERLAARSDPRVTLDTAGLSPAATALANLLAEELRNLPDDRIEAIARIVRPQDEGGATEAARKSKSIFGKNDA